MKILLQLERDREFGWEDENEKEAENFAREQPLSDGKRLNENGNSKSNLL